MSGFLTTIQVQLANADQLLSAWPVQRREVLDGLMARFREAGVAIDEAPVAQTLDALASLLGHERGGLHRDEAAVQAEKADDVEVLQARAAAEEKLRGTLGDVRTFLRARGEATLVPWGLEGEVPTNAAGLAIYATQSAALLRASPRTFKVFGVEATTAVMASEIEAAQEVYASAQARIKTEERELDVLIQRRNATRERFEAVYGPVGRIFTNAFRLAGHPGLAERLLTNARRVRGEDVIPSEQPASPAPAPPQPG